MKENNDTINTNSQSNDIVISSENEEMFYLSDSSLIPDNIKEDFKQKQNFLLVFVNPKSGSQQGKKVLEYAQDYKTENIPEYNIISFPILEEKLRKRKDLKSKEAVDEEEEEKQAYDLKLAKFDPLVKFTALIFCIIDKNEMTKGKKFIKRYLSDFPNNKIKILIAGGDGTVLGIVEELNREGIPLDRCIFGAMPFGTGNDLSHSLGFGNECKVGGIRKFHRVLYTYLIGTPSKIDIWELRVSVNQEKGTIFDVIKKGEKIKLDENNNKVYQFKKTFVNYFSLGFDARVGFQFEQRRSSSRFCNKFIYAVEAAKRIFCCKKNYGLSQLLDSFQEGTTEQNINSNNKSETTELLDIEEVKKEPLFPVEDKDNLMNENRRFIFKTKKAGEADSDIVLKGNPVNIICQNIDFYMGGTQNIWDKSSHIGITQEEITKKQYKEYRKEVLENFKKQAFDDKKIEFFTYEHGIEMGLERVNRGMAKRVYQGSGPVYLEFKKNPDETEKIALSKVYVNCDGEFYHLENPTEISVRLNTNICEGQINILKNEIGL